MRKAYQKPALIAESFQLTDHVSGACNFLDKDSNYKVSWHSASNCSLSVSVDGQWIAFFTDASNGCSDLGILPGEYEHTPFEECYNSMSSSYNYFAS